MKGALAGVKVVELGTYVAAPALGQEGKVVNEGPPSKLMDQEELKRAYFSIE